VWYSPHNSFEGNAVEGGRYGTHFMHASDNVVRQSKYLGNVVGVFVMYSHRITIEDSELVNCAAAGGMGVGIKDSGDVRIERSRFVRDAAAVYIDSSPSLVSEHNRIANNRFQLNEAALVFHGGTDRNAIVANDFASNRDQVLVEGGGDALSAQFGGNRFDDYRGYDFDGDGKGDVAYEVQTLTGELTSSHRSLAFFRGTPAFGVIEALGRLVPLFAPKTLFRDPTPRLSDPVKEPYHVH
jgi:nitrous oxidase accessory protein